MSIKDAKHLFDTNFFGHIDLIQAVLPSMRKNKSGIISEVNLRNLKGPRSRFIFPNTFIYVSKIRLTQLSISKVR